jgi:hypothetical protein
MDEVHRVRDQPRLRQLRETHYDIAAACTTLSAHGYPAIEEWLDTFVRHTYRDAEALALFGPRDGRSSA